MKSGKGAYSLIITISMMAGSIAMIGIIVGLFFQILPERNALIRFSEIGFFSLCIPVLIGEIWQRLRTVKCTILHLEIVLGMVSAGLSVLLYMAYQEGGILTKEFIVVIILAISTIIFMVLGAAPLSRALGTRNPQ